jgi:hypothetical protein
LGFRVTPFANRSTRNRGILQLRHQRMDAAATGPYQENRLPHFVSAPGQRQTELTHDFCFNCRGHGDQPETRARKSLEQRAVFDAADDQRAHRMAREPGFDRLAQER